MTINLKKPDIRELRPRITVFGVGGAGGNAVNNMISAGLAGVEFVVANTDAQALASTKSERVVQMGVQVTEGLGAGSMPEVGRAAAEEVLDEIRDHLSGSHMVFVTAGMGGGTGTGASPVIARAARELGILTVGVVTKPFHFEGARRMRVAETGITEMQKNVDTLIVIPNQNLFRVANERTTFADAFAVADQVLFSGVACITDLMVKEGLINLDFADVRVVMREMGKAMMGTGEASGERRAILAAEAAIANPLLDETSMRGARGLLISITGGRDLTLYEVDEAATRIREEVDPDANIILGATFDQNLEGIVRVSVVATGIDPSVIPDAVTPVTDRQRSNAGRLRLEDEQRPEVIFGEPRQPTLGAPPPRAGAAIDDVTIRPLPPKPNYYVDQAPQAPVHGATEQEEHHPFIPPVPERPAAARQMRMPRADEFPLPGQAQLRAAGHGDAHDGPDKKKMTLLQRLAAVGLGRKEGEDEPPAHARPVIRDIQPSLEVPRPPRPQPQPSPEILSEYGKRPAAPAPRPAPQGLDQHGRQAPLPAAEDDHLDIPAFLRRQAN
ncbi:cell division protein FtsZ [Blastochloris sulfoviridis]|uniref:Cell division protein FtsZ n=1 Tax=Blastochloris sulfoviridis TaxID=50712 RepID=A0A5M6I272_9HYPH|nr:cell division protein FtsZ [Blastochloris sulfoviridis]KAA5602310.1 cell division protein FtsZ [Blastochloris sulfoviridis]